MSHFEIAMLIALGIVPIVAFLVIIPWKRKKETKKEQPAETPQTFVLETPIKPEPKVEKKEKLVNKSEFSKTDFKDFMNYKKDKITSPEQKELPVGFIDRTSNYVPERFNRQPPKSKPIIDQINDLSPEMKAILLAGVLDRKE